MRLSETINFPTLHGSFLLRAVYFDQNDKAGSIKYALLIFTPNLKNLKTPLVRIHSSCLFSEVLGSLRCDCREQLESAMDMIQKEGGLIIYLDQEGRGHGIENKIKELKYQDQGLDTVDASKKLKLKVDDRNYSVVKEILDIMNIDRVKLLTNNPRKIKSLQDYGFDVDARVPIETLPNEYNKKYLKTKKSRLGHLFSKYIVK